MRGLLRFRHLTGPSVHLRPKAHGVGLLQGIPGPWRTPNEMPPHQSKPHNGSSPPLDASKVRSCRRGCGSVLRRRLLLGCPLLQRAPAPAQELNSNKLLGVPSFQAFCSLKHGLKISRPTNQSRNGTGLETDREAEGITDQKYWFVLTDLP